jgi:hypothetical protein
MNKDNISLSFFISAISSSKLFIERLNNKNMGKINKCKPLEISSFILQFIYPLNGLKRN